MLSSFERLPAELLDIIFDNIDPSEIEYSLVDYDQAQRTYRALCLTSQALLQAARPKLYRIFNNHADPHSIRGFTKMICSTPNLALQLRRADFHINSRRRQSLVGDEDPRDFLSLPSWPLRNNHTAYAQVTNALACGSGAAQLMTLLSVATQIRSLTLMASGPDEGPEQHTLSSFSARPFPDYRDLLRWLRTMFSDAKARKRYARLKEMSVIGDENPPTPWQDFAPLLHFPALKHFRACVCKSTATRASLLPHFEQSSTLESIMLEYVDIDTATLISIIGSTRVLRDLRVRWQALSEPTEDPHDHQFDVDPSALLPALLEHKDHLQLLVLSNLVNNSDVFWGRPALGSLAGFTALKKLAVDENLLCADLDWEDLNLDEIFPHTLETLEIHTYGALELLGDILIAISRFENNALQNMRITFTSENHDGESVANAMEYLFDVVEGPRNKTACAWFEYSTIDFVGRVSFRCVAAPLYRALRGFGEMLNDPVRQEAALDAMIKHQIWAQYDCHLQTFVVPNPHEW